METTEEQMRRMGIIPGAAPSEEEEEIITPSREPVAPAPQNEAPAPQQNAAQFTAQDADSLGIPVVDQGGAATSATEPSSMSAEEAETLGIPIADAPAPPRTPDRSQPEPQPQSEPEPPAFTRFTTDMYNDMSYRDALDTYNQILEEPSTTVGPLGVYAYQTDPETGQNYTILPPEPDGLLGFGSGARTDSVAKGIAGTIEAVGNGMELAGAFLDKTPLTDDAAGAVRNAIPEVNTGESTTDALIAEGVPILASSLTGAGLALRAVAGGTRLIRGTSAALGAETAAAVVSDSDDPTLAIGENAMLPILNGVNLEDSEANDIIEGRLNLLADGLVAGGVVSSGTQLVGKGLGAAYKIAVQPLVRALRNSPSGLEAEAITRVLDQLGGAMENYHKVDAAGKTKIREQITSIVEENRSVLVDTLDTADDQFEMTLDTMTALSRGLPEGEASRLRQTLEGLRSGQINRTGSATLEASNQPARQFQDTLQSRVEEVGGATPSDQTATMARSVDELAEQGRREVTSASQNVQAAEQALNARADDLIADLSNDVELSEDIRRLASVTGTEIDTARTASRESILDGVRRGYETMRDRKNTLYGQLDSGPIDVGSLYDTMSSVNLDELSRQATDLRRSSPLREIAELLQPRMVPADGSATDLVPPGFAGAAADNGMRQETRDEVIERVQGWFARDPETYNFGFFNNVIRPELSTLAGDLYNRNQSLAGRAVRDIVRTIDNDMVDYVRRTDPQLADTAEEAKRFYQDEFAPLFRDGRLQDYANLYDSTIGRTENMGRVNFTSGSRNIVDQTMQSGDAAQIGQFVDALNRTEAGGDPSPVAEYMVADSISSAADGLRASSGRDAQIGSFVNRLRQYSEALRERFPDRATELDTFATRVQGLQGDREALQRTLDEAQDNLSTTVQRVRQGELKSFFRRNYGQVEDEALRDLATASDPEAAFKRVILNKGNDATATMQAIMDRVSDSPAESQKAIRDGLETAYMRLLRDQFFGQGRESGDLRTVIARRMKESSEEIQPLFNVGDVVFRDRPEVMDALRMMTDLTADTNLSRNARPIASQSPTAYNTEAMTAANRLIYTFIGPLSRAGTRVRAGVGALLEAYSPDERAGRIMDNILADPDYFVRLSRQYNRAPSDPQARDNLVRGLLTGFVRAEPDEEQEGNRSVIKDAAGTERRLTDQMDDILQRVYP